MYRNKTRLILASASPRRRELLRVAGIDFKVIPSRIPETDHAAGNPARSALRFARAKAEAVAGRQVGHGDCWYLAADTIVVLAGEILGKPRNRAEARRFLRRLSGQSHQVISGYCLLGPATGARVERAVRSLVKMRELSAAEIEAYLDTDEPYDKAGAYAAQGKGAALIAAIRGSYTNVVGLPMAEVVNDLLRLGVIAPRAGHG